MSGSMRSTGLSAGTVAPTSSAGDSPLRLTDRPMSLRGRPVIPGERTNIAKKMRSHPLRTLAITQNITLDGSIEMLGDWFAPQEHADLIEELHRQDSKADGFLVGRQTFEDLRGYWPKLSDDATGVTDYLNRVQKYVISSTMIDPQWENSTILSGDPVENVRALKEKPGQDIVVTGSITLCHTLIEAGLVDEYRLFVYPVVQGRGRRLFPDGFELPKPRLLETKAFRSGITLSRYAAF